MKESGITTSVIAIIIVAVIIVAGVSAYVVTRPGELPPGEEEFRIAAVLPTEINDMDWSQPMYETLMRVKQAESDWEVTYVEQIYDPVDAATYFRSYAEDGYDLIIAHGSQFPEATAEVARDFPNQYFWVSGGAPVENPPPNYFMLNMRTEEAGYLTGSLAALMTETDHIGFLTGLDVGTLFLYKLGVIQGAQSINPDIIVDEVFTGDFRDVEGGYEGAITMIEAGADVILPIANGECEGVIIAAEERGVWVVSEAVDKSEMGPNSVIWSTLDSFEPSIYVVYEASKEGRWLTEDEVMFSMASGGMGIKETFHEDVPQSVRDYILDLYEDIKAGKIEIETPF